MDGAAGGLVFGAGDGWGVVGDGRHRMMMGDGGWSKRWSG